MRFEEFWIGESGEAIGAGGCAGLVESVLGEAEVVEEMGVVGILCSEGGEELEGGREVTLVECGGGLSAEGILLLGGGTGAGVGGPGRELGVDWSGGEEQQGQDGCGHARTDLGSRAASVFLRCLHGTPPPRHKVCKVFEPEDIGPDLMLTLSVEARSGLAGPLHSYLVIKG